MSGQNNLSVQPNQRGSIATTARANPLVSRGMRDLLQPVRKAGDLRDLMLPGDVKMTFAWCPPGSFQMGSDSCEMPLPAYDWPRVQELMKEVGFALGTQAEWETIMGSTYKHEKPVHEVHFSQGFWMGVTPVTQAQWRAIMGNNPSNVKDPQLPVEQVSWNDAGQFCIVVRQKCGIELRLPTEAQWEYACRAGTKTDYCNGNGEGALRQVGWFYGHSTKMVGQLNSNAWNLHDMHGNVWEWCADWYDENYYAQSVKDDPKGPTAGSRRVARGGCYYNPAIECRSACRGYGEVPEYRHCNSGFRVSAGQSEFK